MPRLTLSRKVFLALATMLVLLLLIFTGFSIFGLQRGLGPYVAEIEIGRLQWLATSVETRYAADGGWDKLRADRRAWPSMLFGDDGSMRGEARRPPPRHGGRPPFDAPPFGPPPASRGEPSGGRHEEGEREPPRGPDPLSGRLGLTDTAGVHVAGAPVDFTLAVRRPLLDREKIVGYLVLAPMEGLESEADRAFLARQSGLIAATGLAGLLLALGLSWWLARRWFAPIDDLTQGAERIAQGRLETRVAVRGSDELALLGSTFNSMAERLDTIETSRRDWLADVAHELRTPLAAMRAEIEALQDGIRTFDDRTALRLHRQVMRLSQLVDDLRSSMREAGRDTVAEPNFVPIFPLALLSDALAHTRDRFAQRDITVDARSLYALAQQPVMLGDAGRLHQVFMNLLENTLRHTRSGGRLRLTATVDGGGSGAHDATRRLLLHFDDSAPGPSAEEIPRLFDRLFRGETSRNRGPQTGGGSGLGLSICRAIVEELGGCIEASASSLGGLHVALSLPLAPET
ncbi:MAG: ATP-binding protein [Janthinobacterium lividum]